MPDPRYAHCPECAGGRVDCPRCDGEGIVTTAASSGACGAEYRGTLPGGDVIDTCRRVGTHDAHEGKALRWRSPLGGAATLTPSYPEGHGLYFRGSAVCWCGRMVLGCPAMNEWVAIRG